jgi:fatty acid desaturase
MSGKSVRQQFMKEFRVLRRNSETIAALTVVSYIGQMLLSVVLGYWLLQLPLSLGAGVMLAVLVLFAGTRIRGLNNILHECSHFSFCESRSGNILLGRLCASLLLNSFRDYREEHLSHHAHLGDYDNDQDFQRLRKLRLEDPLTPGTVLRHVLTALSGLHLPYYVNVNLRPGDGEAFRLLKLALVAAATGFLVLAPVEAIILVWLPFLWVYPAINYLTDCIDHGGLIDSGDELRASRNLPVPKQLRVLLFPRNDCYHLVHHLFPQIPTDHLQLCHERLLSHPEYRQQADTPVLGRGFAGRADDAAGQRADRGRCDRIGDGLATRRASAAGSSG